MTAITPDFQRNYWPTQEWRIGDPNAVGIDSKRFPALEQMIQSQYRNINGIVIVRKGYIVFERYYNNYGPEDIFHVASVTKSVLSALIGIAIDKGYIKSVDQKILEFFPGYHANPNDFLKKSITIKHILTMTAPFAWKTTNKRNSEPLDRLRRQRDWVNYTLGIMGQNGQLGKFQYCTAGPHLLSAIITQTTGMSAREFANVYLFRPLGMREIPDHKMNGFTLEDVFVDKFKGWVKDPSDITIGGWGLTISTRDMARFGYLYLNGGNWEGNQIIPQKWIEDSISNNPNQYGYLWWLREEKEIYLYSALGAGGNVICCIPSKDLIIAISSKIIRNPRDPWILLDKGILPLALD